MQWSDLDFQPTTKTLRQFAALSLIFLFGLAAWHGLARGRTTLALALAVLAIVVGTCGFVRPATIRWIFVGCLAATFPIGWLMSWLLLGGVYYFVFTPVACCFRLIGRDALCRRFDRPLETYWTEKPRVSELSRYFRQF